MIRPTEFPPRAAPHAKIAALFAGSLAAGALALFALGRTPPPLPAPAPIVAVAAEPESAFGRLRSASYYPEQLAAMQSLSSFQPIADQGEKRAPVVLAVPAKPAQFEPKPLRRADAPAKSVVAISPAAPPQAASAPVAAATPVDQPVKFLGVPVPGAAQIGDRVVAVRDTAGRWGSAVAGFGEKLATFWH